MLKLIIAGAVIVWTGTIATWEPKQCRLVESENAEAFPRITAEIFVEDVDDTDTKTKRWRHTNSYENSLIFSQAVLEMVNSTKTK